MFDFCSNGWHHHCVKIHTFGCVSGRCNDYCQGSDKNECFESFIKNSDDINYQCDYLNSISWGTPECMEGSSPLHIVVCGNRHIDNHVECRLSSVNFFLCFDGRTTVNDLAKVNLNGPLAQRRVELLGILLSNPRINVNLQDDNGNTPLIQAALLDLLSTECRNQIISALLAAGADVTIKNNHGLCFLDYVTRLDAARGNHNLRTVYEVLKGQKITAAYDKKTIDALTEAAGPIKVESLNEESNSIPPEILEEISEYAVGLPNLDTSNSSK